MASFSSILAKLTTHFFDQVRFLLELAFFYTYLEDLYSHFWHLRPTYLQQKNCFDILSKRDQIVHYTNVSPFSAERTPSFG